MFKYLFYILFSLNLVFTLFFFRKKIRRLFFNPKIKTVELEKIDDFFKSLTIDENLKAPNKKMITNTFFVPSDWNVVGMTSDYEGWILSVLSKKSYNIFEFGTCSGKTTYLFALNSPKEAKIFSITLPPQNLSSQVKEQKDNSVAFRNAILESKYEKFMFSLDPELKNKIKVIFQDSKNLDIGKYENLFDLIFIDGGHSYSCVKNDTEKALKMIKKNGFIFWHDYSIGKKSHKDIYFYLNELRKDHDIFHIKNTSLCFYIKK